ncbi:amino acid ABC transporter substrate-binding protein, partial [Paracoccus sp. S4493]
ADMPDARLVIAGPIPPQAQGALSRSRLWQALPQVAQGRVHHLPRMNAFGGVPAALRFGDLLARALEA